MHLDCNVQSNNEILNIRQACSNSWPLSVTCETFPIQPTVSLHLACVGCPNFQICVTQETPDTKFYQLLCQHQTKHLSCTLPGQSVWYWLDHCFSHIWHHINLQERKGECQCNSTCEAWQYCSYWYYWYYATQFQHYYYYWYWGKWVYH